MAETKVEMRVEGPAVDGETYVYTVHSPEGDLKFAVMPETMGERSGWGVCIESVPEPSIVHPEPWQTPEAARDAALNAVQNILALRRMQREEAERYRPKDSADEQIEEQEPESRI